MLDGMASKLVQMGPMLAVSLTLAVTIHATAPLQMQWSTVTYGPDGPWHAVTVRIGRPAVPIDLYPASQVTSYIPNPHICSNDSLIGRYRRCPTAETGLWNYNHSKSADPNAITSTPALTWFSAPISLDLRGKTVLDTIFPTEDDTISIPNSSVTSLDAAYYRQPNGATYPPTIGSLGIGCSVGYFPVSEPAPHGKHTRVIENIVPGYLAQAEVIDSASYGLHIGSVRSKVSPSMVFGGYDKSRVLGPILSQPVAAQSRLSVKLVDISIGLAEGASPFPFKSKTGLLSTSSNGLNVYLEPGTPYMFLPKYMCEAIIKGADLPVSFDSNLALYIWDISSPKYGKIISSASYLAFKFRGPHGVEIEIKAPWQLFDLTLGFPLANNPTKYFPCSPYAGPDYVLGRTFLQAAFIGVNWRPAHPPSTFFLAQAPGPRTAQTPLITPIYSSDINFTSVQADWKHTWHGHWAGPFPETTVRGSALQASKSPIAGLSPDAKIGIGVGVGVGVGLPLLVAAGLCLWLIRRRRQRRQQQRRKSATPSNADTESKSDNYFPYGNRHEAEGVPVCEVSDSTMRGLPGNPAEVDGSDSSRTPSDSTSQALPEHSRLELDAGAGRVFEKGDSDDSSTRGPSNS